MMEEVNVVNSEELTAIEARLKGTTDGPWSAGPQNSDGQNFVSSANWGQTNPAVNIEVTSHDGDWKVDLDRQQRDAEFIAHARDDVPALIAAVRHSQQTLREVQLRLDEALARFR